jgi:hypothetical protein
MHVPCIISKGAMHIGLHYITVTQTVRISWQLSTADVVA